MARLESQSSAVYYLFYQRSFAKRERFLHDATWSPSKQSDAPWRHLQLGHVYCIGPYFIAVEVMGVSAFSVVFLY